MTPYPLTAVVGHDDLKRALLANVLDPRIGGVLIRGDRGTAKTTLVRGLASLMPPVRVRSDCPAGCDPDGEQCPFCRGTGDVVERPARVVELPLGATEDRVTGTLDLSLVLQTGERRLEPGLLAAAHRGILYIDEVNLLPDHLVDLLLDVSTSGVNVVERDGDSIAHAARFVLVGTMNPEEGDLRPQLVDRFGLVVDARTSRDAGERAEIVNRRIAFDRGPDAFLQRFEAGERVLRERLITAQALLPRVDVPAGMVALAVGLCIEAGVDGSRADIALYRTAAAFAALDGRVVVEDRDVYEAALLALPHRQRLDGTAPAPSVDAIVRAHQQHDDESGEGGGDPVVPGGGRSPDSGGTGEGAPSHLGPSDGTRAQVQGQGDIPAPRAADQVARPAGSSRVVLPPIRATTALGRRAGRHRRPSPARVGYALGDERWDGRSPIAVVASVTRALLDGRREGVLQNDLRMTRRRSRPRRLVLLLVDASGSMGARERMARTKAELLEVLAQVGKHRDRVALQAFRDDAVRTIVTPGRDISAARTAIDTLATGGRTPLLEGLRAAASALRRERAQGRSDETLLVLVTDGRYRGSVDHVGDRLIAQLGPTLVLDTEEGPIRLGRARALASELRAQYASSR